MILAVLPAEPGHACSGRVTGPGELLGFLTGIRNRLGAVIAWWPAFVRDLRRERAYSTQEIESMRKFYAAGRQTAAARSRTDAKRDLVSPTL